MESVYKICFYGGLVATILLLVVSILLFVVLKIPRVFGELTGRTAKKSIEEMKRDKTGSSSVSRKEQAKYYNQETGKIKVREAASEAYDLSEDETEVLETGTRSDNTIVLLEADNKNDNEETAVLPGVDKTVDQAEIELPGAETTDDEATVVLSSDAETAVLAATEEPTELLASDEVTSVLTEGVSEDETSILADGVFADALSRKIKVIYNVVIVHTSEEL